MDLASRLVPVAIMGSVIAANSFGAATGTIAAHPNPCIVTPGARGCTAFLNWTTHGARHARVYLKTENNGTVLEREFGTGQACARCGANGIEPGARYVFTLVDFSSGTRGAELASVSVTAVNEPAAPAGSAVISAVPNPCRVPRGETGCATNLTWSTDGISRAAVFVAATGKAPSPEKEFGTDLHCKQCVPFSLQPGTRYRFTLYDFSTGSRGRPLASVVVTAIQ